MEEADPDAEAAAAAAVVPPGEGRGLRLALWGFLGVMLVIGLLSVPSGAPLRNPETGDLFGDSPLMQVLIFLIMLIFLVAGLCYGRGAETLNTSTEAIGAITKTFAGLGGLIMVATLLNLIIPGVMPKWAILSRPSAPTDRSPPAARRRLGAAAAPRRAAR